MSKLKHRDLDMSDKAEEKYGNLLARYPHLNAAKNARDLIAAFEAYRKGFGASLVEYAVDQAEEIAQDYKDSTEKTRRAIEALRKIFEEYGNDKKPLIIILETLADERVKTISEFQAVEEKYMQEWTAKMVKDYGKAYEDFQEEINEELKNPTRDIPGKFETFTVAQSTTMERGAARLVEFKSEQMAKRGEKRTEAIEAFSEAALVELGKIHRRLAKEQPRRLINRFKVESSLPGWNADKTKKTQAVNPFSRSYVAARALAMVRSAKERRAEAAVRES